MGEYFLMKIKLKKVTIYGFKSFAEKTQFVFDSDITGIVGPNGCGKSNIVDAIYWVFQNHSLKTLRANEKQDLIFKGNDIKPPAGFAEVEIVFDVYDTKDNEIDGTENLKEEFSIKKRLYPSGEVIYYLNKKEVRPKDISEFLKNYSINTIDYSIIGQGSVSKIIDMKPEDRVELIESAAGIKNIKNDRIKAFVELSKTDENLKSVSLLLEELENEVNKLKQQADKAKLYKELNEKIVFSEQALAILKYRKLLDNLNKLQIDFDNSTQNLKKYEEKILEIENLKSNISSKIKEIERNINEKRENIFKLESDIAVIEKTILLSQKRYEELGIEKRRKIEDLQFFQNRLKKIDEVLSFPINEIKEELEYEINKKEELESEITKINEKINNYNSNQEKSISEVKKIEKQLKELYKEQEDFLNEEITNLFSNLSIAKMKVLNLSNNANLLNDDSKMTHAKLISLEKRIDDILKFSDSSQLNKLLNYINEIKKEIDLLSKQISNNNGRFEMLLSTSKEIESLLFGKDSIFTKFQEFNDKISSLDEKIDVEKNNLSFIEQELASSLETKNLINKRLEEINRKIFQLEEKIKNYESNKIRLENEKVELLYNIKQKEEEISQLESNLEKIKKEGIELIDEKDKIFKNKKELDGQIRDYEKEIDKYKDELTKCYIENESVIKEKNNLLSIRENFNITKTKIETQCESIRMSFYENYRIILSDDFINSEKFSNIKESEIRNVIFESRKILEEIGQVNFLSIEEYEEVSKRYNFINKQKQDIIEAKEKIIQLINELDEKIKVKFIDAFDRINENFKTIFCEVFGSGNASMILTKPDNIYETGIEIVIQPPGKNISNISLLSGGETAMSSISLLFAFFLYNPSPFCIMDEVDAPFDENNIMLFKRLIQRFSKDTQFFLISHNKLTLEIADILYGITMENDGISKVVSVKLEEIKNAAS